MGEDDDDNHPIIPQHHVNPKADNEMSNKWRRLFFCLK